MLSFGAINLWALERQDLGHHYRWANDDKLRRLAGVMPQPRSMAQLEAWYQTLANDPRQEVYSVKSGEAEMLGWVHLHDLDLRNGSASVGVVVDPQHWRKGVGFQALAALAIHAFDDLRLFRLEAEILSMNHPSKALFAKLGFGHEGTRRQSYFTAGRRLDVEQYGLLASEFVWPRLAERPEPQPGKDTEI
jgi:RimJ/RimL family protein N-acetyltransferase